MGNKIITVDSGRQFVKVVTGGKRRLIQSLVAPAPVKFNLEIKENREDLFIGYQGRNYLIGGLALRQSTNGIQERSPDKTNEQNILLVLTACSLFADPGDNVTLLTNVPARDWGSQRQRLAEALNGSHRIEHKAGEHKGRVIDFTIRETFVIPEGEAAFYGYIYDQFLNVIFPALLSSSVLVLDIGDQTCNYISMNPGGEPFDSLSGSLDLGMFRAYAGLQLRLEERGLEVTQGQIADALINHKLLYHGRNPVHIGTEIQEDYSRLAGDIYDRLNSRLKFNRYQYILMVGGGGYPLHRFIKERVGGLCEVFSSPDNAQWLNALGAEVIYKLSQRG
jgi:hypothetical protein